MRNIAVAVPRQLGFPGKVVAAVMGLTPNYVATLHQRALREGTAGLVRPAGPAAGDRRGAWDRAQAWRAAGAGRGDRAPAGGGPDHGAAPAGPGARAGGAPPHAGAEPLQEPEAGEHRPGEQPAPGTCRARSRQPSSSRAGPRPGAGPAGSRRSPPGMRGRCCCTRSSRGRPPGRCSPRRPPGRRDVALLSAVSMCFALGAATMEQFKHLAAAEAGPLAGLGALPGLRTLRPELAAIADRPTRCGCSAVRVGDAGRGPGDLRRVLRR